MATVTVKKLNESTFEVTVEARTATTHTVAVDPAYAARLTDGKAPVERLVERSFDFLLEREPNTSILRRFDLPMIGHYFPEYEKTIKTMLA
ncbi:hypothetical protein ACWJKU_08875 [Methylocaldum sp. MU1018]